MKFEEQEDRPRLNEQFSFFCSKKFRKRLVEVSRKKKKSLSSTIRTLIRRGLGQEEEEK